MSVSVVRARRGVGAADCAAALSLVAASAHLLVMRPHFDEWWAYGMFFAAAAAGQLAFALLVTLRPHTWVLLAGIAGNAAIVVLYVMSRGTGVPLGPHAGRPETVAALDWACTAAEARRHRGAAVDVAGPAQGPCRQRADADRSRAVGGAPVRATHLKSLLALALGFALLALVRACAVEPFAVVSSSMAPTVDDGDHVLVNKLSGALRPGDLVIFEAPPSGKVMLKRVVALAGQVVEIKDGVLHIDGRPAPEPYVDPRTVDSVYFGPLRVPQRTVFVLGDLRAESLDSRTFGPVPASAIIGRVEARVWPPARL